MVKEFSQGCIQGGGLGAHLGPKSPSETIAFKDFHDQ